MIRRAGFIGLGTMGLPMVKNILKGGYEVSVFDIDPDRAEHLSKDFDVNIEKSIRDLGRNCDKVITMLPNSEIVSEVTAGNGALFDSMRPGSTWIDMTTSDPFTTAELAQQAQQQEINVVDAPVGRSPKHAEEGTLLIMTGGDQKVLDEVKPLLLTMASDVIHCGPVGAGHTMKLINNLLSGVIQEANVEALSLGIKAGLNVSTMLKVFKQVAVWNGYLEGMPFEVEANPGWEVTTAEKQLGYVKRLAQKHNVPIYCGSVVRERMSSLIATGYGDTKFSSLTSLLKNLAGVDVAK